MLHDSKSESDIKIDRFFQDAHELYVKVLALTLTLTLTGVVRQGKIIYSVSLIHPTATRSPLILTLILTLTSTLTPKVLLSPFYEPSTAIKSREFDSRVRDLLRKHLGTKR